MTHFSDCAGNVRRKVFKVVLSSLSVNAVSVSPVNVVEVTTTPTFKYTNPASMHAVVRKPVFSTTHVDTSPAPAVFTFNPSLPLQVNMYICDVPVPANYYVMIVKCLHPYLFLQISPPHSDLMPSLTLPGLEGGGRSGLVGPRLTFVNYIPRTKNVEALRLNDFC